MRNWYSPVSSSVIVVSVAVMLVTSVVCRASLGPLVHRVRQALAETECDPRVHVGNCSQHSLVRKVRPDAGHHQLGALFANGDLTSGTIRAPTGAGRTRCPSRRCSTAR